MTLHEADPAVRPAIGIKRAANDDRIESIESSDLVYGNRDGIKAACFGPMGMFFEIRTHHVQESRFARREAERVSEGMIRIL